MASLESLYDRGSNNFNPIRLIAAVAVVYGHAYAVVKGGGADFVTRYLGYGFTGGLAVDAFFVISGFLVTASILKGDVLFYAVSRALRILPALWVCLALIAAVFGPLLAGGAYSWPAAWRYFWHQALLWKAEFFLPGVFAGFPNQAVNGVLWSVLIEARMYVLVLALFLAGVLRRKSLFNGVFFAVLLVAYFVPLDGMWFASSATDRHVMLLFLIGSFAWVNRDSIPITPAGVMACLFALAVAHRTDKFPLVYLATFPYLIFGCAFGAKWPWPERIGDWSYGVYLWGWPLQQAVLYAYPEMSATLNHLLAIPLALLAGAASWHWVEEPMLRHKRSLTTKIRRRLAKLHSLSPTIEGEEPTKAA